MPSEVECLVIFYEYFITVSVCQCFGNVAYKTNSLLFGLFFIKNVSTAELILPSLLIIYIETERL